MRKSAKFASPRLEALEGRVVLDVSVTSVAGALAVQGTGGNDLLHVAQNDPGKVTVLALGGTTLNGGRKSVSLTNVTGVKTVNLGAGDDVLSTDRLKLADGAAITGGTGRDVIRLTRLTAGAGTLVDLGAGDDRLSLNRVTFTGKASMAGGDGRDTVFLHEVGGDGAATIDLGAGGDALVITQSRLKGATVNLGGGDDFFAAYDTRLTGSALNAGAGKDLVVLVGARMDGTTNWSLGAGSDTVAARRASFAAGSTLDGGDGRDTFLKGGGSSLASGLLKNF
jgi:hypothetical protein